MAYTFKSLGDVELLGAMPTDANVLIEVDGGIKRAPGAGLGGGVKTAIIMDSNYMNALSGVAAADAVDDVTYSCINMTFDEACQTLMSGEPLLGAVMLFNSYFMCATASIAIMPIVAAGAAGPTETTIIIITQIGVEFIWTASGISVSSSES